MVGAGEMVGVMLGAMDGRKDGTADGKWVGVLEGALVGDVQYEPTQDASEAEQCESYRQVWPSSRKEHTLVVEELERSSQAESGQ